MVYVLPNRRQTTTQTASLHTNHPKSPGTGVAAAAWSRWGDATDVAGGQSTVIVYGLGTPGRIAAFFTLGLDRFS